MATSGRRWRFGLRERLLAVTLVVAIVAIVLTAWAANRQTESDLRAAFDEELAKPQLIYNFYATLSRERPSAWSNTTELAQTANQVAERYGVRVRLEYASDNNLIWDSATGRDASAQPPDVLSIKLLAPPTQAQLIAADDSAQRDFETCLAGGGDPDTCARARLRAANAEDAPTSAEHLLLYVVNPRLTTGSPFGGGVDRQLVLTVLGVILFAMAATTLAGRHILAPITRLTRASRRMAEGHLDARVPVDRDDELGDLSGAFNSMASSLEGADQLRRRMTSDIAHELRTPLSNIRGYLEAAQDGVAPLTPALVDSLLEDALLLQTLVNDLQELTVAESGGLALQRDRTDLDDLLTSVVEAHRPRATAAGVELVVEPGAHVVAEVDGRRLRQVFTNLVENALRHTPAGGTITARSHRAGDTVVCEVLDTGTGIAPEHLPHLFERFYRADESRNRATGGSGLGLAITRELVHAHDGQITVTSEVGRGTTFTVTLPLDASATPVAPATPLDASATPVDASARRGDAGAARARVPAGDAEPARDHVDVD